MLATVKLVRFDVVRFSDLVYRCDWLIMNMKPIALVERLHTFLRVGLSGPAGFWLADLQPELRRPVVSTVPTLRQTLADGGLVGEEPAEAVR